MTTKHTPKVTAQVTPHRVEAELTAPQREKLSAILGDAVGRTAKTKEENEEDDEIAEDQREMDKIDEPT